MNNPRNHWAWDYSPLPRLFVGAIPKEQEYEVSMRQTRANTYFEIGEYITVLPFGTTSSMLIGDSSLSQQL